ncbi:MAG: T9SS type A sorting domain-containing protein [Bacteroidales bacterium]|nr:T9SS type A sorting domain-containing protein [Bacteroidales bacterium]
MKKVSLLIAMIAFVCGNAFAQLSFDFNDGVAGAKIAQTYGDPWSTWSNAPGGAEDGVFGEIGGSMAAHFTYGNDQIVQLGEVSTGVYDLEFDAYVPQGKNGYFNVLHHFLPGGATGTSWAVQIYMHMTNDGQNSTQAPGHGTVHAGSNGTCDLPCVYDEWMHFRVHVDADNDVAQLWFNVAGQPEVKYAEWQWSMDSFGENVADRCLGAMDFFPPQNASTSEYYIDNLTVTLQSNDEVLIADPFEEYTEGNKIAVASAAAGHDWWTTWSNAPGGAEDGVVAQYNGTQCGHLTYGNDQVLLLGDEENGNYDLEFDILIPQGKNGYFNILHHFAGTNSKWAMQCYLHLTNDGQNSTSAPGQGTIHAGSNSTATLTNVVYDGWMHFRLNVDTDTDVANFYYTAPGAEEVLVCTWQWSLDSFGANTVGRTLAAMNFFPPENAATSEYYLDNFSFKKIGGESAPHVVINEEAVDVTLRPDNMDFATVTINNEGNSIADWTGWIEFGQGPTGSQTAQLALHNGNNGSQIGSDSEFLREMGVAFRPSAYAGTAMGMQINSLKYYINPSYSSADGHYTFRLYGQGVNNQPGTMLAQTTINTSASDTWIEGVFDAPVYLTGQVMWATVEVMQAAGEYPLSMDDGHYGENQDGNWLSTSGNAFSHCYSEGNFDGAWQITAMCSGTLVPATWVSLDKTEGSIMGGQSETLYLTLNSINLNEGEFTADLMIFTNDPDVQSVTIPITLTIDPDDVAEADQSKITVYPNPASSILFIKGENLNTVAIYNVAGQLVGIEKLGAVENRINLNMGSGVYFFSIYDNEGNNTVQRVVVSK